MNIVNLTEHQINIFTDTANLGTETGVVTIAPSGIVARIKTEKKPTGHIDLLRIPEHREWHAVYGSGLCRWRADHVNIPVYETTVENLPPPHEDTIYVVSGTLRVYFDFPDLYRPGELVRDDAGQPIGCIGLSR